LEIRPSLQFLGAVDEVTGSMHLLQTEFSRILLDCGLYQGHRKDFYEINSSLNFSPEKLNGVILSHAHIDHSGNIPTLIRYGFNRTIYTTRATLDLCNFMLPDSGHVQEEDIKFVNKIQRKRGEPLSFPLYTAEDAKNSISYFRGMEYLEKHRITDDLFFTFCDAGHVLGSAVSVVDIMKDSKRSVRLAYAVDLGRRFMPFLRDPVAPKGVDYLILETTYGGRFHADLEETKKKFADAINRTVERGGKILIPSFALERTQLVLYYLRELSEAGKIPRLKVYLDSPLAINITGVFQAHMEYFNDKDQKKIIEGGDIFGEKDLVCVNTVEESKKLNDSAEPCIIIAGSGMCEAGRILHHLRNNVEDEKNTIMVVGYMAKNTLGRRIVEREEKVRIFGEEFHLNAEVVILNAFSAHADQDELIEYVKELGTGVKKIFLVHGENGQRQTLYEALAKEGLPAYMPAKEEVVFL
jgi:metallo-beta-lactamase family protein